MTIVFSNLYIIYVAVVSQLKGHKEK